MYYGSCKSDDIHVTLQFTHVSFKSHRPPHFSFLATIPTIPVEATDLLTVQNILLYRCHATDL